jgi:hypothetical protein
LVSSEANWTLAELVVWICTRDLTGVSLISNFRSDAALAEVTYKLHTENLPTAVSPPDLSEIRDGAPKDSWDARGNADNQIMESARDGSVKVLGRRTWEGPSERISPAEFIGLRIGTMPDSLRRGTAIIWFDVQISKEDALRRWPAQSTRGGQGPMHDWDRLKIKYNEIKREQVNISDHAAAKLLRDWCGEESMAAPVIPSVINCDSIRGFPRRQKSESMS